MSAKLYSPPLEIEKPKFNWKDVKGSLDAEQDYVKKLSEWCKKRNQIEDQNYIGATVRWPVADSHAVYMVAGLEDEDGDVELIHVPIGDEWTYEDADLQTKKSITKKIDGQRALDAIFSKKG